MWEIFFGKAGEAMPALQTKNLSLRIGRITEEEQLVERLGR
jgi:hypothetical protein